ncbi:Lipoprotein signal peptidase [hydrothermal vent metagenome]|uniref:Lipoprotein signal peptidase n=1 Tax=hydrothermal vent metagenome TaxID=652676 RepID=A0A3B0RIT4_9ZZZZ
MKLSRSAFIIVLIIVNIALDQISKIIVRTFVVAKSQTQIIGDYFTLHNVENEGAFLGLGSDLNPTVKIIVLLILPAIVLGFVTRYLFREKNMDRLSLIGFSCIIGGGIANVFDRIVYGSVTDFFHIDLGGVFRTGIFNVADMSVTFGMIMIITASFIYRKKK